MIISLITIFGSAIALYFYFFKIFFRYVSFVCGYGSFSVEDCCNLLKIVASMDRVMKKKTHGVAQTRTREL